MRYVAKHYGYTINVDDAGFYSAVVENGTYKLETNGGLAAIIEMINDYLAYEG